MNLKLHHIGIATYNIEKEFQIYKILGYKKSSLLFEDKNQKVRGLFIEAENQPRFELLENISNDGPLNDILSRGIKYYHMAYETENIEKSFFWATKTLKAVIICPVIKANYFKKVCFLMLRNGSIIEFVEPKGGVSNG